MLSHDTGPSPFPRIRGRCLRFGLTLSISALAACTDLPTEVGEEAAATGASSCASAGDVSVGQTHSGQLSQGDCPLPGGGFSDRWTLTLATATSVRIDLRSVVFDPFLELHDASGAVVAWNDDTMGLDSRINQTLAAGTYVVLVRAYAPQQSGSYTLSVMQGADCSPLGTLSIGETVAGTLEASDCVSDWDAPMDNWTLTLTQAQRLRVDVVSGQLDEVLLIRDAQGWVLHSADWNHPAGHARLDIELPAGSWTVSVTAPFHAASGAYELTVLPAPPCGVPQPVVVGQAVAGSLDPADCTRPGGAFTEPWELVLSADSTLRIDLKSAAFDTYLILKDETGSVIAIDDDGGEGLNSRLERRLSAGTYVIEASSYSPGATGPYALDVDVPPATPVGVEAASSEAPKAPPAQAASATGAWLDSIRSRPEPRPKP